MAKRSNKKAARPSKTGGAGSGGARGPQPDHHGGPSKTNWTLAPPGFAYEGIRVCTVTLT